MGFCKSDQKSIPVVGFLTRNDCDVLRAKTGLYRRVTHRTIILPTMGSLLPFNTHSLVFPFLNTLSLFFFNSLPCSLFLNTLQLSPKTLPLFFISPVAFCIKKKI